MTRAIGMASAATYRIYVQGCFPGSWADWFEDTAVQMERDQGEGPRTALTCRVKDQAALLGILMKLNGLNAPIIQVTLLAQEEPGQPVVKEQGQSE